ncbi:MAG TPA: altronate dehydratase family protein [Gammaproteobacteria bacterium]|nr:altronate dehydratase family protein [Gammaproteobacteria bacterium]
MQTVQQHSDDTVAKDKAPAALTVHLHPDDNVAIAKTVLPENTPLTQHGGILVKSPIPAMHKLAIKAIAKGEQIRKYNQTIGIASTDILAGEHVHTHNCELGEIEVRHAFCKDVTATEYVPLPQRATFQGYRRQHTQGVGTRNFIGVLTTVNCSATVAQQIANTANQQLKTSGDYSNIDGVASFVHTTGCGMKSNGDGYETFLRVLHGYIRHPNFGGLMLVGLGCEVMQISRVLHEAGLKESDLFRSFTIQDQGGTRKAIDAGLAIVREMLPKVNLARRETVPASEIMIGLQCGGSDAFSGITANPALGAAIDILVRHGGTGILSETPEIYGAEHLLTRRAVSPQVAEKLMERLEWWKKYAQSTEELNNNPSPGNKAGGLTTILEKSLGAQAKGGTTNMIDVYKYGEPVTERGFVFMDSPGYDPVSATGQIASGANIVCFTTGRGSAFGCKPVPSIKLATNTRIFRHMHDDMDINCGGIMDGEYSVQESGAEIFKKVLSVASGEKTKSEELGYGDNEFNPWVIGATF